MTPTGSTLARAAACPASHALPQVRSSSPEASEGSAIHAYLETVAEQPERAHEALMRVPPPLRERCQAIDVRAALADLSHVRTEVAYAIDVETGTARELGTHLGRAYMTAGEQEIALTVDVVASEPNGTPAVLDWKSGAGVDVPADNWQIRAQALAVASVTGAHEVVGAIAYVREDGSVARFSHRFDVFDLDVVRSELKELVGRVRSAEAQVARGETPCVATGEHCRYCGGFCACPAQVALARAMISEFETTAAVIEIMTPEEAGRAWSIARRAEELVDATLEALKARAKREPLPLGGGKEVRGIEVDAVRMDVARMTELARGLGATDADLEACRVRSTTVRVCEVNDRSSRPPRLRLPAGEGKSEPAGRDRPHRQLA